MNLSQCFSDLIDNKPATPPTVWGPMDAMEQAQASFEVTQLTSDLSEELKLYSHMIEQEELRASTEAFSEQVQPWSDLCKDFTVGRLTESLEEGKSIWKRMIEAIRKFFSKIVKAVKSFFSSSDKKSDELKGKVAKLTLSVKALKTGSSDKVFASPMYYSLSTKPEGGFSESEFKSQCALLALVSKAIITYTEKGAVQLGDFEKSLSSLKGQIPDIKTNPIGKNVDTLPKLMDTKILSMKTKLDKNKMLLSSPILMGGWEIKCEVPNPMVVRSYVNASKTVNDQSPSDKASEAITGYKASVETVSGFGEGTSKDGEVPLLSLNDIEAALNVLSNILDEKSKWSDGISKATKQHERIDKALSDIEDAMASSESDMNGAQKQVVQDCLNFSRSLGQVTYLFSTKLTSQLLKTMATTNSYLEASFSVHQKA